VDKTIFEAAPQSLVIVQLVFVLGRR